MANHKPVNFLPPKSKEKKSLVVLDAFILKLKLPIFPFVILKGCVKLEAGPIKSNCCDVVEYVPLVSISIPPGLLKLETNDILPVPVNFINVVPIYPAPTPCRRLVAACVPKFPETSIVPPVKVIPFALAKKLTQNIVPVIVLLPAPILKFVILLVDEKLRVPVPPVKLIVPVPANKTPNGTVLVREFSDMVQVLFTVIVLL